MQNKWILASRPKTLPAAISPAIVGVALAFSQGYTDWLLAACCVLVSLVMQVVANLANDLFDHEKGTDPKDRLGPMRATATGLISPKEMRVALFGLVGVAFLLAIPMILTRGWIIIALGISIVVGALFYSGGKVAYGYRAMGDLFVFVFFGLVATTGTYFVLTGRLDWFSLLVAVPGGVLITNILVINNVRDRFTDERTGKRTMAVIFGKEGMKTEFGINLMVAYLVPFVLFFSFSLGYAVFLPLFSLPLARANYADLESKDGRDLNPVLGKTANLALVYSLLLSAGLVLG